MKPRRAAPGTGTGEMFISVVNSPVSGHADIELSPLAKIGLGAKAAPRYKLVKSKCWPVSSVPAPIASNPKPVLRGPAGTGVIGP